jgi:hypothetical protein
MDEPKSTVMASQPARRKDETAWARTGWDGIVPNVRLIEIVLSEDLRRDFIHWDDYCTSKTKISFHEKVRRKFNDRYHLSGGTQCQLGQQ